METTFVGNPSPGSTSVSLIARIKSRDCEAWTQLVDIYGPLTYYWCRKSGVGSEDARDVVQDIFSAMWKSIDGFELDRQSGSFRGWLATITQSKIADHWRKRLRNPAGAGGTDAQQRLKNLGEWDPSHSGSGLPANIQRAGLLHRAVQVVRSEFEQKTWDQFRRVVLDGESVAEVAAANSVSAAAVRQAKSRVLRRIRKELESLRET